MRVSIVSMLLAGGVLALGACATSGEPGNLTLAERTSQCERLRAETTPTGRQTGDARQDYQCTNRDLPVHRANGLGDTRSAAIDRALKNGT